MGGVRHYINHFKIATRVGRARLQGRLTSSRLAPGRILPESDVAQLDQFHLAKLHREFGNIFTIWSGGKLTTCIVGHELGLRFLTENKASLRVATIDMTPLFPVGFLRAMEGEAHVEYRRLFIAAFRSVPLQARATELRSIFRDRLTQLAKGEGRLRSDVAAKVIKQASTAVMLDLILGAKHGSKVASDFTAAYDDYVPNGMHLVIRPTDHAKYERIKRLLVDHANDLKQSPTPATSLLEYIVQAGKLDETAIGNLVHMTELARHDFHGLARWIFLELAGQGSYLDAIAGESDLARREVMARSAVSETLRMQQSEFILRTALKPIIFDGYLIPRRSRVRICIWEAHRDPTQFPEPDVFKPDRFVDRKFSSMSYAPLGLDHHRCLGANWTLQLGGMLVEEIAENFSLELLNYGSPSNGYFHFEPGVDSQVSLTPKHFSSAP
ncbi:cytochrome P450 [Mesorhizobium sp. ES1-1]|uniref:cytochrome P450 n=1 Tax=Mesorhizobium sp. ES1-1 TaxID=2876629 RepID=UPI001CCD8BBB|nr:cytochrome P450 [Mesorhizobium sp. ES1-1]MBZ9677972.1 cytochrome P450 [Mesorhizobium sp. ES1-1]